MKQARKIILLISLLTAAFFCFGTSHAEKIRIEGAETLQLDKMFSEEASLLLPAELISVDNEIVQTEEELQKQNGILQPAELFPADSAGEILPEENDFFKTQDLIPVEGGAFQTEVLNSKDADLQPDLAPYTIAWMGDIQEYASSYPDILQSMFAYIADAHDRENIIYLIQTGDLINNAYKGEDVERVNAAFKLLPEDLPVFTACGNHDYRKLYDGYYGTMSRDYSPYLDNRHDTGILPENEYLDGLCHYATFSAGGTDFLLLTLAYLQEKNSLDWAIQVCKDHPDRIVILVIHSFMSSSHDYTSTGQLLRSTLLQECPNIRLVLCGHAHNAARIEDKFDDDGDKIKERSVWELLFNYQGLKNGGNGYLRLLKVDPVSGDVHVVTYSPWLDDYNYRERNDEFTIPGLFKPFNSTDEPQTIQLDLTLQ